MNWGEAGQAMTSRELSAEPASHMALRLLFVVCPGGPDNKLGGSNTSWSSWWSNLPVPFLAVLCRQLRPHDVFKAVKRWLPVSSALVLFLFLAASVSWCGHLPLQSRATLRWHVFACAGMPTLEWPLACLETRALFCLYKVGCCCRLQLQTACCTSMRMNVRCCNSPISMPTGFVTCTVSSSLTAQLVRCPSC